jgi:hypothetical protein
VTNSRARLIAETIDMSKSHVGEDGGKLYELARSTSYTVQHAVIGGSYGVMESATILHNSFFHINITTTKYNMNYSI